MPDSTSLKPVTTFGIICSVLGMTVRTSAAGQFAKYLLLASAVGMLSSCSPTSSDQALSILGAWDLAELPANASSCRGPSFISYKADGTFLSQSGALILTGTYTATAIDDERFRVSTQYQKNNGEPNCQGLRPEFVIEHTPRFIVAKREGDRLVTCVSTDFCLRWKARVGDQ